MLAGIALAVGSAVAAFFLNMTVLAVSFGTLGSLMAYYMYHNNLNQGPSLSQPLSELQQQNQAAQAQTTALQRQIRQLNTQVASNQRSLEESHQTIQQMQTQVSQMREIQQQGQTIQEQIRQHQEQTGNFQRAFEQSHQTILQSQTQVSQKSELQQLSQTIQSQMSQIQSQVENFQQSFEKSNQTIIHLNEEVQNLQQLSEQLKETNQPLQKNQGSSLLQTAIPLLAKEAESLNNQLLIKYGAASHNFNVNDEEVDQEAIKKGQSIEECNMEFDEDVLKLSKQIQRAKIVSDNFYNHLLREKFESSEKKPYIPIMDSISTLNSGTNSPQTAGRKSKANFSRLSREFSKRDLSAVFNLDDINNTDENSTSIRKSQHRKRRSGSLSVHSESEDSNSSLIDKETTESEKTSPRLHRRKRTDSKSSRYITPIDFDTKPTDPNSTPEDKETTDGDKIIKKPSRIRSRRRIDSTSTSNYVPTIGFNTTSTDQNSLTTPTNDTTSNSTDSS